VLLVAAGDEMDLPDKLTADEQAVLDADHGPEFFG
jgi:hypothetical protein